ncbi:hypothetical protein EG68_02340 [Paragonimus skrjabini miyazakii]|uniref:Uncharacterized protein n=1 Tax=Paragonimus skrjabini miyazakii TaxID=59628 RepID=A0A8S9YZJ1_9TREM|nr:hypothetical protein EG68_02340 [Paragonimus skrjabini miyazakii]
MFQMLTFTPFLFVAVPIYYRGGPSDSLFTRLTISNLDLLDIFGSWVIWSLTLICTLLFLIVTVCRFIHAYRWSMSDSICNSWEHKAHTQIVQQTSNLSPECQCSLLNQIPSVIMLSNVPTLDEAEIQKELQHIFSTIQPPVKMQWIHLIRDTSAIVDLEQKRIRIMRLLEMANEEWTSSGIHPVYQTQKCKCECCPSCSISCCLVCCKSCCFGREDAIDHYENELISIERILQTKYAVSLGLTQSNVGEQNIVTLNPDELLAPFTGLIFVGFENAKEALQVAKHFTSDGRNTIPTYYTIHPETHMGCLSSKCWQPEKLSKVTQHGRALLANLQLAPIPNDLLWPNILSSRYRGSCWWMENFCKSLGVFIVALFLTSPSYLLMVLNYISTLRLFGPQFSVAVYQWIPAMVLVAVSALVKQLVIASEAWTNHVTYGGREKAGQRTLFAFLVLTVLIFPSLGLGGLPALLMKYYKSAMLHTLRLECIFSPDSSVLFINYVTTCSLLGSGLLLLQFGRWFSFLCRCGTVHSNAEAELLAQENAGPFPFRERYASMALIQTIVVAFAPLAPIILPFGIFYLFVDYLVCSFALVRIYQPGFSGDYGECEQNPENFQPVYHLSWIIQSTCTSLTGICLACFYLLCFFALRARITQLRFVGLGFFALFLFTVFISIILTLTTTRRCLLAVNKCILGHSLTMNKNRDSPAKENLKTSNLPPVDSSVQTSLQIRKAYSPPFVRDLVVST